MTEEEVRAALTPERVRALACEVARRVPGGKTLGAPIGPIMLPVQQHYPLDGPSAYFRTLAIVRKAVEATAGLRYVEVPG